MQSFIVEGESSARHSYINQFIQEHGFFSYNITRFTLAKISDVRFLKKSLTLKMGENESRLIILEEGPTLEAQNALLKTLEEPPPRTFLLISVFSKEELLPTVISRCVIVRRTIKESSPDNKTKIEDNLLNFLTTHHLNSPDEALEFSRLLLSPLDTSSIIISVRNLLLYSLTNNSFITETNTYFLARFLDQLCELYPLIRQNNLNPRFSLEYALLKSVTV